MGGGMGGGNMPDLGALAKGLGGKMPGGLPGGMPGGLPGGLPGLGGKPPEDKK
jgi:signal recognition particle subunit SRP54